MIYKLFQFCLSLVLTAVLVSFVQFIFYMLYLLITRDRNINPPAILPRENRRNNQRAASRQRNPAGPRARRPIRGRSRSLSRVQFNRIARPLIQEVRRAGTCTICLLELNENQSLRKLVCNHIFHEDCLFAWVGRHEANCPVCRRNLMNDY